MRKNILCISMVICLGLARGAFCVDNPPHKIPEGTVNEDASNSEEKRDADKKDASKLGITLESDSSRLNMADIFDFISLQEIDGRRNVTKEWWNQDKLIKVNRLHINKDSKIRVIFNVEKLAEIDKKSNVSSNFASGQLSLGAHIKGRPIEVQGYSEVGKDRKTVGPAGTSPNKFLLDMKQLQYDLSDIEFNSLMRYENSDLNSNIGYNEYKNYMDRVSFINEVLKESLLNELNESTAIAFFRILDVSPTLISRLGREFNSIIEEYSEEYKKSMRNDPNKDALENKKQLEQPKKELAKIKIDIESKRRDINLLRDKVYSLENEQEKLKDKKKQVLDNKNKLSNDSGAEKAELEKEISSMNKRELDIDKSITLLNEKVRQEDAKYFELIRKQRSVAENIESINYGGRKNIIVTYMEKIRPILRDLDSVINKGIYETDSWKEFKVKSYQLNDKDRSEVMKSIMSKYWDAEKVPLDGPNTGKNDDQLDTRKVWVYRAIFKNLVDGQIVLRNAGVKAGDIITLDLLWYQPKEISALMKPDDGQIRAKRLDDKPVSFTIAEIMVEEYDSQISIVDSFLLVKSTTGEFKDSSNFKGAAGVSLLSGESKRGQPLTGCCPNALVRKPFLYLNP